MTDKRKKLARAFSNKTGMSYQAAINALERKGPPTPSGPPAPPAIDPTVPPALGDLEYPTAYLFIHGWRRDHWVPSAWNHPDEPWLPSMPPPLAYKLGEAVQVQRLNSRARLLECEGWNVEAGGRRDGYYTDIWRMRSPIGFSSAGRRVLIVANAFRQQQARGWRDRFDTAPELPAARFANDVLAWCVYCDSWHRHGAGGERPTVGESVGHRVAHCEGNSPYAAGYVLKIAVAV